MSSKLTDEERRMVVLVEKHRIIKDALYRLAMKEGQDDGHLKALGYETALELLEVGVSLEKISTISRLTIDEIKEIQENQR
ncbi:hypothetical protein [Enterococcus sp. DIV0756]|uniref:hypothetical protein n=1 Tax=Enterococcus sp. DIV0756 TaxID=2774636 RepID=UPI003F27F7B8